MAEQDMRPVVERVKQQPRTVADASYDLFKSQTMCDITFRFRSDLDTDCVLIKAHQVCLRTRSSVFEEDLKNITIGHMTVIDVIDASPHVFNLFLEFIYGDRFDVKMTEALDLLYLANKYNVRPLTELCNQLLMSDMQIENAFKVFGAGHKHGLPDLKEKAGMLVARNLEFISLQPDFLKATEETMVELYSRNHLMMEEIVLFQLALKWAESNMKDDNNHDGLKALLANILPMIRFPLMTPEEFATVVIPSKLLATDDIVSICSFFGNLKERRSKINASSLKYKTTPRIPAEELIPFYNITRGRRECRIYAGEYVETFSFYVNVNTTRSLPEPNPRKPIIKRVSLFLPNCTGATDCGISFMLTIMELPGEYCQSGKFHRRMLVGSCMKEKRVEVNVEPPLDLEHGHRYGLVLRDQILNRPTVLLYSWSEENNGEPRTPTKLDGITNSLEVGDYEYPQIVSAAASSYIRGLQVISGVTVVVP